MVLQIRYFRGAEDVDQMTLREKFCTRFQCAPSDYGASALRLFLHRPWSWLAPAILRIKPGLFSTDLLIIEQLGRLTSGKNLSAELRDLRADYFRHRDFGWLRRYFKLRLSGRRISKACQSLWESPLIDR